MTKKIGIYLNSLQKKLLKEENHKVKDDDVSIVELVAVTDGVIQKVKNCLISRWPTFKELSGNKYNTNIRSGNSFLTHNCSGQKKISLRLKFKHKIIQ